MATTRHPTKLAKRGDQVVLEQRLTDLSVPGGQTDPLDLGGATVRFIMEAPDGSLAVNATADVVDPDEGEVEYLFADGELSQHSVEDEPVTYLAEFRVLGGDEDYRWPPGPGSYLSIDVGEPIDTDRDPATIDPKEDIDIGLLTAEEGQVSGGFEMDTASTATDPVDASHSSFGAEGDGQTDDAAAIQAALDSITTGTLHLPPGRYWCGDALLVDAARGHEDVTIRGPDATLVISASDHRGIDAVDVDRLTLEGLDIETDWSTGSGADAIHTDGVGQLRLRGVSTDGSGVTIANSSIISILGGRYDATRTSQNYGVYIQGRNARISLAMFAGWDIDGLKFSAGDLAEADLGLHKVTNCGFRDIGDNGIDTYGGGPHSVIGNCAFDGCARALVVKNDGGEGSATAVSDGATVSNLAFVGGDIGLAVGPGIANVSASGIYAAGQTSHCVRLRGIEADGAGRETSNISLSDLVLAPADGANGITVDDQADHYTLRDFSIEGGERGINVIDAGGVQHARIIDGTITNPTQFAVRAGASGMVIQDVHFVSENTTTSTAINAAAPDLELIDNTLTGSVSNQVVGGSYSADVANEAGNSWQDREMRLGESGAGVVLTTPDGSAQYRIRLDNNGNVVTDQL